jgi:uncharacterized protein YndB with AHSA1/START domain
MHEQDSPHAGERIKAADLHLSRIIDAPRRLVFEAWTKAEHLSRWFAPKPLIVSRCDLDLRAGGVFAVVMRAPDGAEYTFNGSFREVVAPEKIVFEGLIHDENFSVTTITFEEEGGKTTLRVHQTYSFASDATRGSKQGWTATLDQLTAFVAASSSAAAR